MISIVLSCVALVFAWVVNRRSDKVSDHTIQSLQKIESIVAGLSDNTNGLIKAAWDKMLGLSLDEGVTQGSSPKSLAAGVAAEIRADLSPSMDSSEKLDDERVARLEKSLERLERSLQPSTASPLRGDRALDVVGFVVRELRDVSPVARELLYALRTRHLTLSEYRRAEIDPTLRYAVGQLRDAGLLVPFVDAVTKDPVYYLSTIASRAIEPAMSLLPTASPDVRAEVESALSRLGYSPH